MNRFLSGLYSGFIATGPMTLWMMNRFQKLPAPEQSPLPPATLSYQVVEKASGISKVQSDAQTALTMTSHFGYGALAGVLYASTFARMKRPPVQKGILFGVSFWMANYLGITPALGMRANAPNMSARRNSMMLLAHVVWGGCMGYACSILEQSGRQLLQGSRKAMNAE